MKSDVYDMKNENEMFYLILPHPVYRDTATTQNMTVAVTDRRNYYNDRLQDDRAEYLPYKDKK